MLYEVITSVDLVLTDLGMPVMSGVELMRVLRKRYPNLHVVVLSVHQDFEYVQERITSYNVCYTKLLRAVSLN